MDKTRLGVIDKHVMLDLLIFYNLGWVAPPRHLRRYPEFFHFFRRKGDFMLELELAIKKIGLMSAVAMAEVKSENNDENCHLKKHKREIMLCLP